MELLTTLALAATLSVPARASANVSLAADGRTLVAVWSAAAADGQPDIYAAVSADAGVSFGGAVKVNSAGGGAKVNGEQPPRVVLTRRAGRVPAITVIWTSTAGGITTLLSAQSSDAGRTFTRPAVVPGSTAAGNRGWQSATVDAKGAIHALWLDHRDMAAPAGVSPAGHAADVARADAKKDDGVAMAMRSAVYTSILGQPGSVRTITKGVCYCCKTAIASAADGTIYAAWRNVYPGGIRDIAATVSRDGGRTFAPPARVSDDNWLLNGCPDDGPAMVVDSQSQLHIVWPTLVTGKEGAQTLALFYATSRDGRTFTPRQTLPTQGVPHHPQIAVRQDGSVIVGWDESGSGTRQVAFAEVVPDGAGRARLTRRTGTNAGAYPVMAVTPDGIVAAWTAGATGETSIRVERLEPR